MDKTWKQDLLIASCLIVILILLIGIISYFSKSNIKEETSNVNLYFDNVSNKREVGKKIKGDKKQNNIYYKVNYPEVGVSKIDKEILNNVNDLVKKNEDKYNNDKSEVNTYVFIDYESYIGFNNYLTIVLNSKVVNSDLKVLSNSINTYHYDIKNNKNLSIKDIFKEGYKEVLNKYNKDIKDEFNFIIKNDGIYLIEYNILVKLEDIKDYLNIDVSDKKDYTSDIKETIYKDINKEMEVTEDILVFEDDKFDSNKVGNLSKKDKVKVYSEGDNGFSIILYNDKIGYVDSKKLKDIEVVKPPVKPEPNKPSKPNQPGKVEKKTYYVITDVNVRSLPSTKGELLGVLKVGDKVTRLQLVNGWAKIEYKGKEAYVSQGCLSTVKIKKRTVKLDVPPQGNIDKSKPMVAITFDDGPNNKSTVKILNILEKYKVRATFFDLGNNMLKYPEVSKREARLGEVGTHTYSHPNLNTLSKEALDKQYKLSIDSYRKVFGKDPILFRAPYGNSNANVRAVFDMPVIYWTVDTEDWKSRNKDIILDRIDRAGNLDGKIILMHSIYNSTADAVEILVPDLLDRGYQIVTVSELATYKGYELQTGTIYYHFYNKK